MQRRSPCATEASLLLPPSPLTPPPLTPQTPPPQSQTPLHFAARVDNADNVESLLVYGAHVDALTTKGKYTPLMFAAGAGHVENIEHLIDHHCNKELRNLHYQNAVMRAAAAHHDECVSTIVNHEPGEHDKKKKKGSSHGKKGHGRTSALDAKTKKKPAGKKK